MARQKEGIISAVEKGSLADRNGLRRGDCIVSVNDRQVGDVIDLTFALSDEEVHMVVRDSLGHTQSHYFQKRFDEGLGISVESAVFDHIRQCSNQCSFCFIDQMPRGMRESLYVKDDDYRMSFLYGNFITLTNLTEKDIERIRRLHLSPLYVSVHTTNGKLRKQMMKNPRAEDICAMLEKLADCGIEMNTQIVLCPGINDGPELEATLQKLYSYGDAILSVAIVPVGLSRFREHLTSLAAFDEVSARRAVRLVEKWQKKSRSERNRSFAYLGDEFYLTARMPMPPASWYDGFPELEDGIGMVRKFEEQWKSHHHPAVSGPEKPTDLVLPCGTLIGEWLRHAAATLHIPNLKVHVVPVENDYFGHGVHVTGLLTAEDIMKSVRSLPFQPDGLIIPGVALRKGEPVFLDDVTLEQFQADCGISVKVCQFADDFLDTVYQWK